jgi:hypothetical protein
MANLAFSPALGRLLRIGEPDGQLGRSTILEAFDAIDSGDGAGGKALIESFRFEQQILQDIYVDWIWAMLTWIRDAIDENAVERVMRETLGSWASARYANYLDLSFEEQVALTVEGMRGHLSGPGRLGNIDVTDEGDRVVIAFDPCGSGGRARRGDPARGIPPSDERPEFGDSDAAHPWTWGRQGVCLYCSHCSLVNEILPIERLGFPMRVTQNPVDPADRCTWTLYRDPRAIPADAYTRVGKTKPTTEELQAMWDRLRAERGMSGREPAPER